MRERVRRVIISFLMLLGAIASLIVAGYVYYFLTGNRELYGAAFVLLAYSLLLIKIVKVRVSLGSLRASLIALLLGSMPLTASSEFTFPSFSEITMVFIGALAEELLFRGVIQAYLDDDIFAVLVTALFFSLAHSLSPYASLTYLFNIFLAGLSLGLWKVMGGLLPPTLLHASWNLAVLSFSRGPQGLASFEGSLEGTAYVLLITSITSVLYLKGFISRRSSA